MNSSQQEDDIMDALLKAACGEYVDLHSHSQRIFKLPCFALKAHQIQSIPSSSSSSSSASSSKDISAATPHDFHSYLCQAILKAKHRILLASLYIGPAAADTSTSSSNNNPCEKELLMALQQAATASTSGCINSSHSDSSPSECRPTIQILMDASRGLRPVGNTYSAQAVYNHIHPFSHHPNTAKYHHQQHPTAPSTNKNNNVFLFPVLHSFLQSYIPSPLDEVAGVFHIKAYIIDDKLILTGANLSEEYFTDRQDRYLVFTHGANGLVDFYVQLFHILTKYAYEYTPSPEHSLQHLSFPTQVYDDTMNTYTRRQHLAQDLSTLFQAYNNMIHVKSTNHQMDVNNNNNNNNKEEDQEEGQDSIVAYAIPTFQAPKGFFKDYHFEKSLSFPSDTKIIHQLLSVAAAQQQNKSSTTSVRLSSAYLNPTPKLLSILTQFGSTLYGRKQDHVGVQGDRNQDFTPNLGGKVILLTAGSTSHGFAPKKNKRGVGKDRSWVPTAFQHIVDDISSLILPRGGNIILYERQGWTFHAKGLWLTINEQILRHGHTDIIQSPDSPQNHSSTYSILKPECTLLATVVGSGNFGYRSETLDFESNTILIMNRRNHTKSRLKTAQLLVQDWNALCHHVTPYQSTTFNKDVALKAMRQESFSMYYKSRMKRFGLKTVVRFGRIFF